MIVAGVLWMVGGAGQFDSWYWMLMLPALIAQWVGMLALNAYVAESVNRATRGVSMLAVATNGIAIITWLGTWLSFVTNVVPTVVWPSLVVSLAALFLLMVALALLLLRQTLLPRWGGWGGLPLLLNMPLAILLMLSISPSFGPSASSMTSFWTRPTRDLLERWPEFQPWLVTGVFTLAGLGLLLVGLAMLPPKVRTATPGRLSSQNE